MKPEDHQPPPLSFGEKAVLDSLAHAWNTFLKLRRLHPDEQDEFRHAIHAAQHIIMARPVAKLFADQRVAVSSESKDEHIEEHKP